MRLARTAVGAVFLVIAMGTLVHASEIREKEYEYTISRKLIEDGQKAVVQEVVNRMLDALFPPKKIALPFWGELEEEFGVAKVIEVSDGLMDQVADAAKKKTWDESIDAFITNMAVELLVTGHVKIVVTAGKVAVGSVEYVVGTLDESYREAVANRFLEGRGGVMEKYRSYLRGITPFYQWGVGKEKNLNENLDNLLKVFPREAALKDQWKLYADWVLRDFGGRDANRQNVENELNQAGRMLQEIWKSQQEERAALAAIEWARSHKNEIDGRMAKEIASYGDAARLILEVAQEKTFTIKGKVTTTTGVSLAGKEMFLKIGGPKIGADRVIRAQGALNASGEFSVPVKGIAPGMTTISVSVDREECGLFRYNGATKLPVFPDLFKAFDAGQWSRVKPPPDIVTANVGVSPRGPGFEGSGNFPCKWRVPQGVRDGKALYHLVDKALGARITIARTDTFVMAMGGWGCYDANGNVNFFDRMFIGTFSRSSASARRGTLEGVSVALSRQHCPQLAHFTHGAGPVYVKGTLTDTLVTATITGNGGSATFDMVVKEKW